jgi:predicted TIM-barrel fold metal-dependent hydrolase
VTVEAQAYPHPRPDARWLAQRAEAALDPALPIVDAHHHLWDRSGEAYLLDDFLDDVRRSGHDVVASVFVQCGYAYDADATPPMRPVGETRRVVRLVRDAERAAGTRVHACDAIVGHADLRLGDAVDDVLEAHALAGEGRFRGVRHSAAHDPAILSTMLSGTPPAGMLADPAFRRGCRALGRRGLSFDAWVYHPQLPELADLAWAYPEVPIALNHAGGMVAIGPYARDPRETFRRWRAGMQALAACPNVVVKIGGLARPVAGFRFHEQPLPLSSDAMAEAWRPHVETCIESFGAGRCMFESNFPVDKGLTSYGLLWNAFKRLASGASDAERRALFGGNARRFYRLDAAA